MTQPINTLVETKFRVTSPLDNRLFHFVSSEFGGELHRPKEGSSYKQRQTNVAPPTSVLKNSVFVGGRNFPNKK